MLHDEPDRVEGWALDPGIGFFTLTSLYVQGFTLGIKSNANILNPLN